MYPSLWKNSLIWRWSLLSVIVISVLTLLSIPSSSPHRPISSANFSPSASQNTALSYSYSPIGQTNPQVNIPSSIRVRLPPAVGNTTQQRPSKQSFITGTDAFDISFPIPQTLYPPNTKLHLVGVYEGLPEEGKTEQPWWAKCPKDPSGRIIESEVPECHQKYAGLHTQHEITINLSYHQPSILALMAYEPVIWRVQGDSSNVRKVILAGYNGQNIKGIADDIPVEVYTYNPSNCVQCKKLPGYFGTYKQKGREYQKTLKRLKEITGLTPASFQGSYRSRSFSITPTIVEDGRRASQSYLSGQPEEGQVVRDSLSIGNYQMPLPPGEWQIIVLKEVTSQQQNNTLISLAKLDSQVMQGLYAIHIRELSGAMSNGFPENKSCLPNASLNYFTTTISNEPWGDQVCYWGKYEKNPWQKTLFLNTQRRFQSMGIMSPTEVINIGFHKATKSMAVTSFHYINPEAIDDARTFTGDSWDKKHIAQDKKKKAFIEEQKKQAEIWFDFFRLL